MNGVKDHIGVCVPTFKRPQLLGQLLQKLARQQTHAQFRYSLHVVDNDCKRSAERTVAEFARSVPLLVTYDVEPVQNISLARNRAIRSAQGNFVAFIDDDEAPPDNWLRELYVACRQHNADGVLGPVKPFFEPGTPLWLKKSGLCDRPSHRTGTVLSHLQTRTGNVLFKRSILDGVEVPFPIEMGNTGGEDMDFFKWRISRGYVFVWCDEAPVYEIVTPDRYRRTYHLAKNLRIGGLTGEMVRGAASEKWRSLLRSVGSVLFHGPGTAATLPFGRHLYMKHSVKLAYHLGRICGCLGFVPVRYRRP